MSDPLPLLIKEGDFQFRYDEKITPSKSGLNLLIYGTYLIRPGVETATMCHSYEESLLFCIKGTIKVILESTEYRLNYYDTLYIPLDSSYGFLNESAEEVIIIICRAKATRKYEPFLSVWKNVLGNESRIRHLKGKDVFLMFDVSEQADKLMAGYTIYQPHIRAWPAHNHTDQEEIYIFTQGKGSMEVYLDEETKTFVHNVGTLDAVTIPVLNYHPVFSQGEELHFIWCIAGSRYWVGDKNQTFMQGIGDKITT